MGSGSGSEEEAELASVEEEHEGGRESVVVADGEGGESVKWRIRPMSLRRSRHGFQPQSARQRVEETTEVAVPFVDGFVSPQAEASHPP